MGRELVDYMFDGLLIVVWPNVVGEWKGLVAMGNGCDVDLALSATSEKTKQLLSQLQSRVVGHKFNSHGETLKHQSSHCHCVVGGVVLGLSKHNAFKYIQI